MSSIVEDLLTRPTIKEAAARAAAATGRDAAECLRTAMWLHRSSLNVRSALQVKLRVLHTPVLSDALLLPP